MYSQNWIDLRSSFRVAPNTEVENSPTKEEQSFSITTRNLSGETSSIQVSSLELGSEAQGLSDLNTTISRRSHSFSSSLEQHTGENEFFSQTYSSTQLSPHSIDSFSLRSESTSISPSHQRVFRLNTEHRSSPEFSFDQSVVNIDSTSRALNLVDGNQETLQVTSNFVSTSSMQTSNANSTFESHSMSISSDDLHLKSYSVYQETQMPTGIATHESTELSFVSRVGNVFAPVSNRISIQSSSFETNTNGAATQLIQSQSDTSITQTTNAFQEYRTHSVEMTSGSFGGLNSAQRTLSITQSQTRLSDVVSLELNQQSSSLNIGLDQPNMSNGGFCGTNRFESIDALQDQPLMSMSTQSVSSLVGDRSSSFSIGLASL